MMWLEILSSDWLRPFRSCILFIIVPLYKIGLLYPRHFLGPLGPQINFDQFKFSSMDYKGREKEIKLRYLRGLNSGLWNSFK